MYPLGIEIRPAKRADRWAIRALVLRALLDPIGLHWQNFLVAECNGRVIGCGQIRTYLGVRELGSLVVHPVFRGQGVGSALVRAIMERVTGMLFLQCRRELIAFYERFGFQMISTAQVPLPLRLKLYAANLFIAPLRRTKFVAMRHRSLKSLSS